MENHLIPSSLIALSTNISAQQYGICAVVNIASQSFDNNEMDLVGIVYPNEN